MRSADKKKLKLSEMKGCFKDLYGVTFEDCNPQLLFFCMCSFILLK